MITNDLFDFIEMDVLVGSKSAYRIHDRIYVSPAIYYFLNDEENDTKSQVLNQVKIVDISDLIDELNLENPSELEVFIGDEDSRRNKDFSEE